MLESMAGQTVVITHGAGGLGPPLARRFGRAQARIVIADADQQAGAVTVRRLQQEGLSAGYARLDLAHPERSHDLVDGLIQEVGPITVWINGLAPGRLGERRPSLAEAWTDSLSALSTAFYCAQAVAAHMQRAGGGVILNLTSVAGHFPSEGQVTESVAAAGLVAMTQALGIEWAARGVRVAGLAVGAVPVGGAGTGPVDALRAEARRTPLRRPGSAEEIAEAAFFIAGDAASYIVAETLPVDGGWSAYQMF